MKRAQRHKALRTGVAERVKARREERAWTQRALAQRSGLSPRYLAQLEAGEANISIERLDDLAQALGCALQDLLSEAATVSSSATAPTRPAIALLGLRGAGKSTVGRLLAERLGVPFVEVDRAVEEVSGLTLAEIFELHGESYYRRLERELLKALLAAGDGAVLATSGGMVTDAESYRLLQRHAVTVWLRARPEDHFNRVIEQGDHRPMAARPHAMAELRALLAARLPLYRQAAHTVDTSRVDARRTVEQVAKAIGF